jgi:arabinan endo-1,5-alpha-L-arabinosidase
MPALKPRWPFASLLFGILMLVLFLGLTPLQHVHDPSTIIQCGDEYWLFATGVGIVSWHSTDLLHWQQGPSVFTTLPGWARDIDRRQSGYFWAPDIIHRNGQYLLYYVVSKWGQRTSAIGLATNPTLNPTDPAFHWTDRGIVIQTAQRDDFNALDPSVLATADGRMWMALGSFWTGIKLTELDPATGLRRRGTPLHSIAWAKEIEAPYITMHGGRYYLFVNWGLCCRGIHSTYEIRVGRSSKITGPYRDKNGVDLLAGGGTLFLGTEGSRIGPGQTGILREGDREWISYHYYDARHSGLASLGLRELTWDAAGWPVAGRNAADVLR